MQLRTKSDAGSTERHSDMSQRGTLTASLLQLRNSVLEGFQSC